MTELSPGGGNAAGPVVAGGRVSVGSRKIPGSDSLISIAAFVVLLVVWEIAVRVLQVPDYILPAPSAISMSLFYGLKSGLFVKHFFVTAFQTLAGFLLAAFFGIGLGALIAEFRIVERTIAASSSLSRM